MDQAGLITVAEGVGKDEASASCISTASRSCSSSTTITAASVSSTAKDIEKGDAASRCLQGP